MKTYRDDIDGLRCVAVLLVLLFHVQIAPFSGGFIGVDVFFVISGFLVTNVIMNAKRAGTFRYSDFYVRRIRRLFPALFATVIGSLLAGWFLFSADAYSDLAQSSIATLLSGSNVYFWATSGYFDTAAHYKPLLHTWSLAIEEQFYLVWPLAISLIAGAAIRRHRLIVALALMIVVSTLMAEWAVRNGQMTAAFFLLPFRMNEFAIGAILAFLPSWKNRWGNHGLAVTGLAGMVATSVLYSSATVFPGVNAMSPCLATAAIIYAGRETAIARILATPFLAYLGRASYSIYLAHWPIIAFYLFWRGQPTGLGPAEQSVLLAASLGLGLLMYHVVEVPFRIVKGTARIAPNISNRDVGRMFVGTILGAVIVCCAISTQGGLPSRYNDNPDIRKLLESAQRVAPETVRELGLQQRGHVSLLLVGDSHALAVRPAFYRWGLDNNVRVKDLSVPGCIPLFGVQTSVNNTAQRCETRNVETLPAVDFGQYDLVVLLARWGLYTSLSTQTDHPKHGTLRNPLQRPDIDENTVSLETSRARYIEALRETVETISQTGTPVLFVGQVPHVGRDPLPCVSTSKSAANVDTRCNFTTLDEVQQETAWANEAAREVDGLIVFDPTDLFCSGSGCQVTRNGNMLYVDSNHLSETGAERLIEGLEPDLLTYLGR